MKITKTMLARASFPQILDSTMLLKSACPAKFFYEHCLHLHPSQKSIHLHAGGAFAHAVEIVRKAFYIKKLPLEECLYEAFREFTIYWGEYDAPEGSYKDFYNVFAAVADYFHQYNPNNDYVQPLIKHDGTPAVEFTFSIPLPIEHPDTKEPLVYAGRCDMVGTYQNATCIVDEKTTYTFPADWARVFAMRGQFIGYCLHPEHEVLTRNGWKSIALLEKNEEISVYHDDGTITFEAPSEIYEQDFSGELVCIEGGTSHKITPDHRMIFRRHFTGKVEKTFRANNTTIFSSGDLRFISGGKLTGGRKENSAFIKLCVAWQADGCKSEHVAKYRFLFKKARKIDRLKDILNELGVAFDEAYQPLNNCTQIAFYYNRPIPSFGSWLLELDQESLNIFIDELQYWDGYSRTGRGNIYCNKDMSAVSWVRTIAALTGYRTSWVEADSQVCFSTTMLTTPKSHTRWKEKYTGKVYCLAVSTKAFLTRLNGNIVVTGNTYAAQFYHMPASMCIVRGIAIQQRSIKHLEAILQFPQWQIDRWHVEMLRKVEYLKRCWEEREMPLNYGDICSSYGGCPMLDLCTSHQPENWFDSFEVREWNPLSKAEASA